MACKYWYHKLGNTYIVSIGGYEIAKFWFGTEDEAQAPTSKLEAEKLAEKMVDYLNKNHPISDEMAEKYGDSDEVIVASKVMDRIADSITSEQAEKLKALRSLMMLCEE